jgi:hypothetical protein
MPFVIHRDSIAAAIFSIFGRHMSTSAAPNTDAVQICEEVVSVEVPVLPSIRTSLRSDWAQIGRPTVRYAATSREFS